MKIDGQTYPTPSCSCGSSIGCAPNCTAVEGVDDIEEQHADWVNKQIRGVGCVFETRLTGIILTAVRELRKNVLQGRKLNAREIEELTDILTDTIKVRLDDGLPVTYDAEREGEDMDDAKAKSMGFTKRGRGEDRWYDRAHNATGYGARITAIGDGRWELQAMGADFDATFAGKPELELVDLFDSCADALKRAENFNC